MILSDISGWLMLSGVEIYVALFILAVILNIPQQVYRLSEKAVPPFRGKCTAYPPRCTAHSLGYDVKII